MPLTKFIYKPPSIKPIFYFVSLVLLAVVCWLVFENVLRPPTVETVAEIDQSGRVIDPDLENSAIALMLEKEYWDAASLADFSIYILKDEITERNNEFVLHRLSPTRPLDSGYNLLRAQYYNELEATSSGDLR